MVCSTPPARASNPEESALPKEEAGDAEKTIRVDQGNGADVAGGWPRDHQQTGGECAGGFQQQGDQVVVPDQASGENRQRHKEGGTEHTAAAVRVRVGAIGEGDIERAGGGHGAARRIAQRDAGGQRERHAQRVAQRHHRLELRTVETRNGGPEGGGHVSSRITGAVGISRLSVRNPLSQRRGAGNPGSPSTAQRPTRVAGAGQLRDETRVRDETRALASGKNAAALQAVA